MTSRELEITNGPDKADLLSSSANGERRLRALFDTPVASVQVQIDAMQELGDDGFKLALRGHLTSGNLRGAVFIGAYDCQTRTGRLVLKTA